MIPTPEFKIGDAVYCASANWSARKIQCPDCLGTAKWEVKAPSGETWEVACNTCNKGWHSDGLIDDYGYHAHVKNLTIGSVRIDTASDRVIEYMCEETGIGSGTVYSQDALFTSEDIAKLAAEKLSERFALEKQEQDTRARQRNKKERIYKPKKAKP